MRITKKRLELEASCVNAAFRNRNIDKEVYLTKDRNDYFVRSGKDKESAELCFIGKAKDTYCFLWGMFDGITKTI